MAKFTISYKWPEYDEGIREAKRTIPAGDVERVCDKFDIGEYLDIELDTVAMTCEVVQRGRLKSEEEYVESTAEWQEERDAEAAEIKAYDDALREDWIQYWNNLCQTVSMKKSPMKVPARLAE